MDFKLIENLLQNHGNLLQNYFVSNAKAREASYIAKNAMFYTVRTEMEQDLINLIWKDYYNLEVTEDDLKVIDSFNHWYNLGFDEHQNDRNRYLEQSVQVSRFEIFKAFERLKDQLPNHQNLAIKAFEALGVYILTESERNALNVLRKLTTPGLKVSEEDLEKVKPLNLCDKDNQLEIARRYISSLA